MNLFYIDMLFITVMSYVQGDYNLHLSRECVDERSHIMQIRHPNIVYCAFECEQRTKCVAFNYHANAYICELFNTTINDESRLLISEHCSYGEMMSFSKQSQEDATETVMIGWRNYYNL